MAGKRVITFYKETHMNCPKLFILAQFQNDREKIKRVYEEN